MELDNKVAIVTGAAQGIGRAIAEKLAGKGAKVYILDYNFEAAKRTAQEFHEAGMRCAAIQCDISAVHETRQTVVKIIEQEKRIDILVNNAGITQKTDLLDLDEENWDRVFSINLRGPFFLTQIVFRNMMEHGGGKIVNIASLSAERGGRFAAANYACSKGGVLVLTKVLALRGGEYGITANAIAPGLIKTAMADQLQFSTDDIPLGRLGTPEEIAEAALFLASDRSNYMTGATLDLNGGQLMR